MTRITTLKHAKMMIQIIPTIKLWPSVVG